MRLYNLKFWTPLPTNQRDGQTICRLKTISYVSRIEQSYGRHDRISLNKSE